MIPTLAREPARPPLTVRRIMVWVLMLALVLGVVIELTRGWSFWSLVIGILYIPVLPALILWQMRIRARPDGTLRREVVLLILCYVAWLGALVLTFRALLSVIMF
jgi:hypothetical protein